MSLTLYNAFNNWQPDQDYDTILSDIIDNTVFGFAVQAATIDKLNPKETKLLDKAIKTAVYALPAHTVLHFQGAAWKKIFTGNEARLLPDRIYLDDFAYILVGRRPARIDTPAGKAMLDSLFRVPVDDIAEKAPGAMAAAVVQLVDILENTGLVSLRRLEKDELACVFMHACLMEWVGGRMRRSYY